MANVLIQSLAYLVRSYFDDLKSGGVECRLVLPALTEEVAIGLQSLLIADDLPAYLVVPKGRQTDKEARWIRAEAVTSVRQGDMIVVVWPGEMSRIQDSVIGAGGAMRNFAFSDEWPWIPTSNEYFVFDGPVTDQLFKRWAIADEARSAFRLILNEALETTQDSFVRGRVFLDQMIGEFELLASDIDPIGQLLRHLGIPTSSSIKWGDPAATKLYFNSVRAVLKDLVNRVREPEGKADLIARALEMLALPATDPKIMALNRTLDSLTLMGDDRQDGILTLHGCWADGETWKHWTLEQLKVLLDFPPDSETIELIARLAVTQGIASNDSKTAVLVSGGILRLEIDYSGVDPSADAPRIFIFDRSTELFSNACDNTEGTLEVELEFDSIFTSGGAKKRNLRIVAMRGERELARCSIKIIPCGPNSPLIAVLTSPSSFSHFVAAPVQHANDEIEAEKTEVDEPVSLVLVSWDVLEDDAIQIDGGPASTVSEVSNVHVHTVVQAIDPSLEGIGQTQVRVLSENLEIALDIEAKNIVRGEFTLEKELIVQLSSMASAAGHRTAVHRLVEIFSGNKKEVYGGLGGLDDVARRRIAISRLMETTSNGRPILMDLLGTTFPDTDKQFNQTVIALDGPVPLTLVCDQFTEGGNAKKEAYLAARRALLDIVISDHKDNLLWPYYACLPIFVESEQALREAALSAYLQSYLELLGHISCNSSTLSLAEIFSLTCVDCVVHWTRDHDSHDFALLGPWHPLVIAKRYMVQAALFQSARHHMRSKSDDKRQLLSLLLDQVSAVHWFAIPANDGRTLESYYVTPTSDPGWLLAVAHGAIGTPAHLDCSIALRTGLGLDTGMTPTSHEQVTKGYLQDFFNAYPTRRSISVAADSTYDAARLIESAQSLIYDGDSLTQVGRLLPGGIHIAANPQSDVDVQEWRSPPVCLYESGSSTHGAVTFSDIRLLSSGRASSSREGAETISLPRGRGLLAAFNSPIRQVGKKTTGLLHSRAYERDLHSASGTGLGELFTKACCVLSTLPAENRIIQWEAELPMTLNHLWTVIPGNHVDPAVFVRYVAEATEQGESASLWDYSMSVTGAVNSYFVLSQIPRSVIHELNKSPVLDRNPLAPSVLGELGRVGMALGGESLRSGSKALGVIGVVAAVRLFIPQDGMPKPIRNTGVCRGFLLPVDSFHELLGGALDGNDLGEKLKADLLAVQIGLKAGGGIAISCCAIECKYSSNGFGSDQLARATSQAESTLARVKALVSVSKQTYGLPERLALLALVSFGLRLSQEQIIDGPNWQAEVESRILQSILDGDIEWLDAQAGLAVVVTDCSAGNAKWQQQKALFIRVGKGHWPGISESAELAEVRERLSQEFSPLFDKVRTSEGASQSAPVVITARSNHGDGASSVVSNEALDSKAKVAVQPATTVNDLAALMPVMLGTSAHDKFSYDPQNREKPLDNYNIMVTGSSGKGKTQFIKTLVTRLRDQNRSVLLLDFKNDFASDQFFMDRARLQPQYVTFEGLPFNPLIPMPLGRPGSEKLYLPISEHINGVVDILKKTFALGDQQEMAVKNAIRQCFENNGLPSKGTVELVEHMVYPDFNDVGDHLRQANLPAYNRLDPLFDLGIFSEAGRGRRFDEMLKSSLIVDLSQIQADKIKNALAKIIVMSAHRYYNARPHSGHLRQFFAFDEAHRVLDSDFMLQFVRECRAYGVGILLSSQYPTDFPADVSASLNTKVIHGNGPDKDRVRDINKILGGEIGDETIANLGMFEAIAMNPQFGPAAVNTIGYPMMLVYDIIQRTPGIARNNLIVPGLDSARLNLDYLIGLLMRMGLISEGADGLSIA